MGNIVLHTTSCGSCMKQNLQLSVSILPTSYYRYKGELESKFHLATLKA